ncbi:MAG: S1 RNA-binding domain-containing protein [Candidatus Sumerlaeia bacterium]|nr:S1 RNA-binding domain-containing protein [Candidatus Sumerlaeia bacterium]
MSSEANLNDHNNSELEQEMAEFDKYMDQALAADAGMSGGALLEVTVVEILEDRVLVDTGGKAEAHIALDEFVKVGDQYQVAVGDKISVVRVRQTADGPVYSHREARARAAQDAVAEAHKDKKPLKGLVTGVVKGGLTVDIGVGAFMPASQVDLFKIPDLNTLVGQEIEAYVIEFDPRRRRAVLSRRQLLFEQRESERREALGKLEVGSRVRGRVKSALEFGAFLDLGGVDGFIPREEVSYDRGTPPSRILKAGEEVEVVIAKVDPETGKITLSRKRALADPWETIDQRIQVGDSIKGTVVSIQNYGAFVHVEEGVTGMIHAGDMSWSLGNKKPGDYVKAGETIDVKVLELDKEKRRLSLGIKQIQEDPWEAVRREYPAGARVKGTVTSLTNYGAFVKIGDFLEGMIHVSDIVWERRLSHPKEVLTVGQEVEAIVLKSEGDTRRLSLGLKQLQESPFEAYANAHPVGSVVSGKVTRFAPFGAFVELAEGLEGLIHISQIDVHRVELPEKALQLGEEVKAKVLKYEAKNRKISLSRKDALRNAERESIKQYLGKSNKAENRLNTFGDALRQAQEGNGKK